MTTDPTPLQERLWDAVAEVRDQHPRVFNDAPTVDVVAAVLPIIAAEVRKAQADAWDEAYRRGVDDARIADELRVDVGLGPDLYAQPARQNPYEAGDRA